jgi:spore coat-associated protein N
MSRFAVFRRHPKRTLTGLAAVLVAVAVAVGSGADFSASSSNTGNSVSAGTLSITNGTAGSIFTVSGLKPGSTPQTSTVDIQNGGSLSAAFSLYRGAITDGGNTDPTTFPFSGKVDLVITDCGLWTSNNTVAPDCVTGTTQKYSGTLAALNTSGSPLALGTFAGSAKHRYQFSVSLDSSADNNYQAGTSSVGLTWSAT